MKDVEFTFQSSTKNTLFETDFVMTDPKQGAGHRKIRYLNRIHLPMKYRLAPRREISQIFDISARSGGGIKYQCFLCNV